MRSLQGLALVVLLVGCGSKAAAPAKDGGGDGGRDAGGDGPRDGASERPRDGGTFDGSVPCNGRCLGNCLGVCTGICSQRTDDGQCAGRCEEICVGECAGTCVRRDAGTDGVRDAAAERRLDGNADAVPAGDAGDAGDASLPNTGWLDRANPNTLSWPLTGHSGAMAYDSKRARVVMFGGSNGFGNTTWEWDGAIGAWELRQQMTGERPSRRHGHAMAFDANRGKLVLHGGIDESGGSNNETWEWDGATETWTKKAPGPTPSRWGHAMVFHAGMGRMVMFGGSYRHPLLGDGDLFDIWEYDGLADTWVNKTYPLPPSWPRARRGHSLAYDAARAVTVLYGGDVQVLAGPASDLWEWDSTTNQWTERPQSPLPDAWPGPQSFHGMAYGAERVLMFGGAGASFWEWNGAAGSWRNLTPSPLVGAWPPARARVPLAWDPERKVLVLSGGTMMVGSNALADLWEWSRP